MVEEKKEIKKFDFNINPEEMLRAGLHFGHKTSRVHPKMMPYISGIRNTVHIIDLEKTKEKFEEALKFIQELIAQGNKILFVGTKIQAKELTKNMAIECGQPYVIERWLGGIFTNFEIIKKRIDYFKDLEKKKTEGELEKYTKKERAKFDKELQNLEIKFGGIKEMEKLPEAIFVLDMKKDRLAIKEAKKKGIKVIGISDTNCDPTLADYPIPANDDAISSIKYILEKVKEAIIKSKTKDKK
jgi:small subunit ribosomal protein S2